MPDVGEVAPVPCSVILSGSAGILVIGSNLVEQVLRELSLERECHLPVFLRWRHCIAQLPAIYQVVALHWLLAKALGLPLLGNMGQGVQGEGGYDEDQARAYDA